MCFRFDENAGILFERDEAETTASWLHEKDVEDNFPVQNSANWFLKSFKFNLWHLPLWVFMLKNHIMEIFNIFNIFWSFHDFSLLSLESFHKWQMKLSTLKMQNNQQSSGTQRMKFFLIICNLFNCSKQVFFLQKNMNTLHWLERISFLFLNDNLWC